MGRGRDLSAQVGCGKSVLLFHLDELPDLRFSSLSSTTISEPADRQTFSIAMILALSALLLGVQVQRLGYGLADPFRGLGLSRHLPARITAATLSKSAPSFPRGGPAIPTW